MQIIPETLSTPVTDGFDLVVTGGGSAGIAAAITGSRLGLRTLLVDPASHLGGTLTSGIPILGYHDGERQVVAGIADEIVHRLHAAGGTEDYPIRTTVVQVDVERLKWVLLQMATEAGVHLRLHTLVAGARVETGRISHLLTEGKGGRRAVASPWVIDTTGDGDVAHHAGVPTVQGRTQDGKTQAMTLMFAIGGIDKSAFESWGGYGRMTELWRTMSADFKNPRKMNFAHFWGSPNRTGEWSFNATRILSADCTDGDSLTRAEIQGREQVFELMDGFLRPHVPGFEKAFVAWTAPKVGVRETRRIRGEYTLTREDIWNFTTFPDTICHGSYPIDIHSPDGSGTEFPQDHFYGGKHWSIPYRSLVPIGIDNLLVAGRCLSATHEALSAVRVMANTLAMGQAAATAIALAHRQGIFPRQVDPAELRRELQSQGAWLP